MINLQTLFLTLSCFAFSLVGTVLTEKICNRLQLLDQPNERKIHKLPVPRFGGFVFFLVLLAMSLMSTAHLPWPLLAGAFIVYAGGFYDDLNPANSAVIKLLFQTPAAFMFAATYPMDFLHFGMAAEVCVRILMCGYVLFMINAANLMDNMNGLTSGLSMIWMAGLAFLCACFAGVTQYFLPLVLTIAAVLGFYLRNFPWGKIYMGDQGSQLLGFLTATFSLLILPHVFSGEGFSILASTFICLLIFSLVFVVDVFTVTVIRLKEKRPVWQGDQSHLSHQLVKKGFTQTKSAMILAGIQWLVIAVACRSAIYFATSF